MSQSQSKNQTIISSLEGSELPVNLDDLPNFKIKNPSKDIFANEYLQEGYTTGVTIQVAVKFIQELEKLIEEKNSDALLTLYDLQFNKLCNTVLKDCTWPAPFEIETELKKELDQDIQALYNELCYRHTLSRLQNTFDSEIVTDSWENYSSIFDSVVHAQVEFPLPVPWIWDIIDEYIYQFYFACRWRRTIKQDDEGLKQILAKDPRDLNFWNLETVNETFESIIQRSQVIENGKLSLKDSSSTTQYFGFFSLVGQLRVNVLIGNYEAAIQSIQIIDFDSLLIFSKAVPAYLSLFYYSGFAYLMTGRYREAVKLFEAICLMMNKYKSFLSKSFQSDNMMKQLEKAACMFAISLVFYPNKQSEATFWQFKDISIKITKQGALGKERIGEKYEKLTRYDVGAFLDLFSSGCPKLISPIENLDEFKNITNRNVGDLMNIARDTLLKDFKTIQTVNSIPAVMKLYSKISLTKAAQILGVGKEEFANLLKSYEKRESSELLKTPFEQTIIQRFFVPTAVLKFDIQGEQITVSEVNPVKNYTEQYQKLNKKMIELGAEIYSLL